MKIGWFVLAGICLLMFTGMINAQDPEPEAEAEAPAEPEAEAPAEPEVEAPAEAPAEPEAEAPAEAPAEPEAEAPAEAPAEPEAEAPAEAPAEPEAEAPAEAPAEPEAEAPAEAPAEPEAEAPAEAPAEPEAEAPAEPEAEAPADAAAEADDQYVADDTGDDEFLDGSGSYELEFLHNIIIISDGGDAVIVTAQPAAATEADAVTDADAVTVPEVVTTPEVTTIEATTEPPTTVVPTTEEPSLLGIQYPDCPNYTLIHDDSRHFSVELARDAEGSADNGTSGWVSYGYSGQPAIIPTQCISMDQCGTRMPFWVDLEDQVMPEVHEETITAKLCASFVVMGKEACCIFYNDVEIFQCHNITLYNHSIQPDVLGRSCVQGAEENITEALENMKECILPGSSLEDIEDNQFDNAITFVIDEDTPMAACNFEENLRTLLALELNSLIPNVTTAAPTTEATTSDQVTVKVQDGITAANTPEQKIDDGDTDADVRGPEGRRRRRSAGNEPYTADCVKYIQPSPKMVDGKMQIYAYVQCEGEDPVDQDQVYEAGSVMQDKQDPAGNPDEQWTHAPMTVERGVHPDMVPASQTAADGTVWDRHKGLLITIIVILIIILIILLIGCMCLKCQKCCDRCCPCCAPSDSHRLERGDGDHRKQPLVQENPITDREMMKGEEPMVKSAPKKSAPLKSAPPPRNTATKEDDNNGYIVPLDQVTQDTKF